MACNFSRTELLDIINKVSFAMDEARLYLDTHPSCSEAMTYFQHMKEKRERAIDEFTSNYGPISSYDVAPSEMWKWNSGPMPWQASFFEGRRK